MPLYDHFRGHIARRPWESFHGRWAFAIADDLNRRLPRQFVADAPVHLGSAVSADVAEREEVVSNGSPNGAPAGGTPEHGGGVATATERVLYAPPATDLSMPADFPPEIKIEVKDTADGYRVIGVVEIVSKGNKKEKSERDQFAAKCLGYLGNGIGLVVIDIVTVSGWNLHNVMVRLAEKDARFEMPGDPPIYAAAYRPVHRTGQDLIDLWHWPLAVGSPLPTVPLALKGFGCVALNLEATYAEACERSRIP